MANVRFCDSVCEKHSTKENGAELFKDHDKKEELLFMVQQICWFSGIYKTNFIYVFLLYGYGTHLVIGSIGIDVEWYIMVGVCH